MNCRALEVSGVGFRFSRGGGDVPRSRSGGAAWDSAAFGLVILAALALRGLKGAV